jgi:hypothetical protein
VFLQPWAKIGVAEDLLPVNGSHDCLDDGGFEFPYFLGQAAREGLNGTRS